MSYKRCPMYFSSPEDRCWRVDGHLEYAGIDHRFAPIPDDMAEQAAMRDLLIQAESKPCEFSNDLERENSEQGKLQAKIDRLQAALDRCRKEHGT